MTDPSGEEGLISMLVGIGIGRGAIETGGAVNQGTNATNLHIANLVRQSMVLNYMISSLEEWRSIGGGLAKSVPYQRELVVDLYKTARKQSGFNNIRSKINKIFAMTAINSVGEMVIVNLGPGFKDAKKILRIPIKMNGFPDFTDYLINPGTTTFIKLLGSRSRDFTLSNTQLRLKSSIFKTHRGAATWHHHEVVGVMMLVDRDTHPGKYGGIHHLGGGLYWDIAKGKSNYND